MAGRLLGRIRSRRDPRTLRFASYAGVPAAPPRRDWAHPARRIEWGMFLNDRLGTCGIASLGHLLQTHAGNVGQTVAIPDLAILTAYEAVGHYQPGEPATDNGVQMLDALRYARATGVGDHKLTAYVALDASSAFELEAGVNLFGGIYVGVDLPLAAQKQEVWDVAPPGKFDDTYVLNSWGPHAVALISYDHTHVTFVTWGGLQVATRAWYRAYVSEAWAAIDPIWVEPGRLAPSGFDFEGLQQDLQRIGAA